MKYRLSTILAREAVDGDKTKVIDLNLIDPVSKFQVLYESVGVGGGSADHHAARCVTKIELVDGSDVLYSLNGMEAQAADWYNNLVEPTNHPRYHGAGQICEMVFNMNFGRFLWDTLYAFDPRKFNNPQLKITIDVDAGGVQSTSGYLTVMAQLFDEKEISPEGFFMHKEIKDYGLNSATHEYTDLPTDFPYRKLFIAACVETEQIKNLLNTVKLSEDHDRKIPLDCTVEQLLRALVNGRPYRETVLMTVGGNDGEFYCTPQHLPRPVASSWEISNRPYTISAMGGWGGKGYLYCEGLMTGVCVSVEGYAPHSVMEIPFGIQADPEDWYDVTKLGSLTLDILSITARTSSDTVQIFLQQARKYP